MKWSSFGLCAVILSLACGCAHSSRHVLISVVDETTRAPLAGVRVSTTDKEGKPFRRKSAADVLTGEDGQALLIIKDVSASYFIHTKDEHGEYLAISNSGVSPNQEKMLRQRPPDYIPDTPDVVVEILSEQERRRRMEDGMRKLAALEEEARTIAEQTPEFWPGTKAGSLWPNDLLGRFVIVARWKTASPNPLGTSADIQAVRDAVLKSLPRKGAKVEEIRWLRSTRVMVFASWSGGSLAGAGYTYVLDKVGEEWVISVRYLDYVS